MTTDNTTNLLPTVKQAYTRALRVPQVGLFAGDPLGVWEDYFEQLHAGLTSCQPCAIIVSGGWDCKGWSPVLHTGNQTGSIPVLSTKKEK